MNKRIFSYKDLDVYTRSYKACILLIKKLLPLIPDKEKYDLKDQLSRSSKAIPRLIAEGYAKKDYPKAFQRYLTDAIAEANETVVGLEQSRDLYDESISKELCVKLLENYDIIGKQLNSLRKTWNSIHRKHKKV